VDEDLDDNVTSGRPGEPGPRWVSQSLEEEETEEGSDREEG